MQLVVNDITKRFGEKLALGGVSFTAVSGRPMGLLGRNGAGKTTAMRIIMNIFEPDSGTVSLDGQPIDPRTVRLGYLPEERGLYQKLPIGEQMLYFARLRGMSRADADTAITRWLGRLGMTAERSKKLETLSKGNQQRIQLALTLLHDPDVVILDEPFSGLDPVNATQLREIIAEVAASGKLVIFSSHQMGAVESFCDDIVILNKGQVSVSGTLSELRAASPRDRIRIVAQDGTAAEEIAARYGSCDTAKQGFVLTMSDLQARDRLLAELVSADVGIITFETMEPSLEEIFVEAAGEEPAPDLTAPVEDSPRKRGRRRR